jgi:hypothetical protein
MAEHGFEQQQASSPLPIGNLDAQSESSSPGAFLADDEA